MGQEDVIKHLQQNKGKWYTSSEIAEAINQPLQTTKNNLSQLLSKWKDHYGIDKKKDTTKTPVQSPVKKTNYVVEQKITKVRIRE